jgi:hypothetical protein
MTLKKNGNGHYRASPPRPPPLDAPPAPAAPLKIRAQKWLQPMARSLDHERLLLATKSSFLIAINGLMLAVSAHALYGTTELGPRAASLIPLALTNLLSLVFAIASAQVREADGALDTLWAKADGDYEPALADVLQSKERIAEAFAQELHVHGAVLDRARRWLRTGYHVLAGGAVLSGLTLAIALAFGTLT